MAPIFDDLQEAVGFAKGKAPGKQAGDTGHASDTNGSVAGRRFGAAKGKITIPEKFDEWDREIEALVDKMTDEPEPGVCASKNPDREKSPGSGEKEAKLL